VNAPTISCPAWCREHYEPEHGNDMREHKHKITVPCTGQPSPWPVKGGDPRSSVTVELWASAHVQGDYAGFRSGPAIFLDGGGYDMTITEARELAAALLALADAADGR
jgi:hypothetical protein